MNEIDERRGAAVHDRHFRRIELDDDVVDAEADERREQVLDRVDLDGVACEAGRVIDAADVLHRGGHFEATEIAATESNAGIGRRRLQRERDLPAGMQTDACAGDGTAKGPLCVHQALWLGCGSVVMNSNRSTGCAVRLHPSQHAARLALIARVHSREVDWCTKC